MEHRREKKAYFFGLFLQRVYDGYPATMAALWMSLYAGMKQAGMTRAEWTVFDLEAGIGIASLKSMKKISLFCRCRYRP